MSQLWGIVRAMQMIALLALVDVFYPPNAFLFLSKMIDIAGFDILSGDHIHEALLTFKETPPFSDGFDALGIPDMNYIMNSASLMLVFFWILAQSILFYILHSFAKRNYRNCCCRKIGMRVHDNSLKS